MKPDDEGVKQMMGDVRPSEIELMAYADGELDEAAAERVRRYVEGDARAARVVEAHRKLGEAGRRVTAVEPPAALVERVGGLSVREVAPPRRQIVQWGLRVAAVLVLGVGAVVLWSMMTRGERAVRGSGLVPVTWVNDAVKVHVRCSGHPDHHVPPFARELDKLPGSLKDFLGREVACPDLSKLGYRFAGCGPCAIPGGKTAHLLYRPAAGSGASVSLFVQNDAGQLAIEKGRVYYAEDAREHTPMIVWRGGGVLYYLVGANEHGLEGAAGAMGVRVRI
jgi:anti-sigma factor RsiW